MFECAEQLLIQCIPFFPGFLAIYLIFDFSGMLFSKK